MMIVEHLEMGKSKPGLFMVVGELEYSYKTFRVNKKFEKTKNSRPLIILKKECTIIQK